MKTGPNDTSGVVWGIHSFLLLISCFIINTTIVFRHYLCYKGTGWLGECGDSDDENGQTDASGVVWAVSKCFLFLFLFIFIDTIYRLYETISPSTQPQWRRRRRRRHVTVSSLHHSTPTLASNASRWGSFIYFTTIGLAMKKRLKPLF
jgi:hypothetical protein